jgi:type IV pilus assembly protein PilX
MSASSSMDSTRRPSAALGRQRGVSLLMSLLLLAVLSIATISAMQTAGLQERISGNTRDRTLAFNAAESALRDAEEYLRVESNLPLFDGSVAGHYRKNEFPGLVLTRVSAGTSVDGSATEVWNDPASVAYVKARGISYGSKTGIADLPLVAEQPRYIIEMMPQDSSRPITYRITAVATGRDASLIVLQNFYTPPQKTYF